MQKFYLKYKDKIWFILIIILLTWGLNKVFDFLFLFIRKNKNKLIENIISFLDKKISISVSFIIIFIISIAILVTINRKIKIFLTNKRKLIIIKATYGKDNKIINITNELNNNVIDNKLNIILSNKIAGDPIYGVTKDGYIKYKYNNIITEKEYKEGDNVKIP